MTTTLTTVMAVAVGEVEAAKEGGRLRSEGSAPVATTPGAAPQATTTTTVVGGVEIEERTTTTLKTATTP
jgi:hypothetical protein